MSRWNACAGSSGRWKSNLIAKCVAAGKRFDDASVSPVVRQTLQHWGYRLTEADHDVYAAKVRKGKSTSFIGVVKAAKGKKAKRRDEEEEDEEEEEDDEEGAGAGAGGGGGGKRARGESS